MFSLQISRSFLHPVHIQFIISKQRIQTFHRHGELCPVDPVFIGLAAVASAGMPVIRHLFGLLYPDILRKSLVQRIRNFLRRHPAGRVKHSDIPQCMHTGICPAGTDDLNRLPQQIGQTPVQFAFDGDPVILDLPAVIIRTVVGHGQADTLCCFFQLCSLFRFHCVSPAFSLIICSLSYVFCPVFSRPFSISPAATATTAFYGRNDRRPTTMLITIYAAIQP